MKKAIIPVVLSLMLVLTIVAISADEIPSDTKTIIAGKIYNSDYTDVINGATVEVTCGGYELDTMSLADGAYRVEFNSSNHYCLVDDTLTVYAYKDGLTGTKTGTVKAPGSCTNSPGPDTENCLINVFDNVNVAVVNVPLVPEFGPGIAIVTALAAVGVFFIVRRR